MSDDDGLICPITLELFHDPVIAEDGRLYERAAITQWINDHGTSPFTRQVLDVNRLQPDDEVRKRAEQRRRMTAAHNWEPAQVQLPPIQSRRNIRAYNRRENRRRSPLPMNRHAQPYLLAIFNRPCDFIWRTCERGFQVVFRTTT